MKPICLKIKGINSFIDEQVVDFERLTSAGLFGIFGPTGSGKTSILDGITLALYGKISRESKNFVNSNCKMGSVSFQFQITDTKPKQYMVQRDFKINKEGTIQSGKCKLLEITDGMEEILEDQTTNLNKRIVKIIGLEHSDFSRTVVIPQGKFSEFLKLSGQDRRAMLERLFNLEQYGEVLASKLKSEMMRVTNDIEVCTGQMSEYEGVNEEALEKLYDRKKQLQNDLTQLGIDKEKNKHLYDEIKEIWDLQTKLDEVKEEQDTLRLDEEKYKDREIALSKGRKANEISPFITRWNLADENYKTEEENLLKLNNSYDEYMENSKEIEPTFKSVEQDRVHNRELLIKQKTRLEDAVIQEKELLSLEININKLAEEEKKVNNLDDLNCKINKLKDDLKDPTDRKEALKKELEEVKILSDIRSQVDAAYSCIANIEHLVKQIQTMKEDYESKQETLDKARDEYQKLKLKKTDKEIELENKKRELENLKEPSTEEVIDNAKTKLQKIKENRERRIEIEKQLEQIEEELPRLKNAMELAQSKEKDNLVFQLRSRLKEGDVCPVCASHIHNLELLQTENLLDLTVEEGEGLEKNTIQAVKEFHLKEEKKYNLCNELKDIQVYSENEIEDEEQRIKQLEDKRNEYLNNKESLGVLVKQLEDDIRIFEFSQNTQDEKVRELEKEQKQNNQNITNSHIDKNTMLDDFMGKARIVFGDTELDSENAMVRMTDKKEEIGRKDKRRDEIEIELKSINDLLKEKDDSKQALENEYNANKVQLAEIQTNLKNQQQNISDIRKNLMDKTGMKSGISLKLQEVSDSIIRMDEEYGKAEESWKNYCNKKEADETAIQVLATKVDGLKKSTSDRKDEMKEMLNKSSFITVKDVIQSSISEEQLSEIEAEIKQYDDAKIKLNGQRDNIEKSLEGRSTTEEKWIAIQEEKNEIGKKEQGIITEQGINQNDINNMELKLERVKNYLKKRNNLEHKNALLAELQSVFKGKRFVEFVASRRLKYICKDASVRLLDITNGDFSLELDEQSMFVIKDHKNGGAVRSASSLSGGETFMASLALALSLSTEIQLKGTAPLELFFLDEGFGTLDPEALDTVMTVVERLHHEKLKVGIISHVESIRNRVPIQLHVQPAKSGGGSKVLIEYN